MPESVCPATGKTRHDSPGSAQKQAELLNKKGRKERGQRLRARTYQCRHCAGYHVTAVDSRRWRIMKEKVDA